MRVNLDQIKKDIDLERNNSIQDAHDLNERIKEVNNEMNRLSVDNRYLTNSFSSLEKRLVKEINQNLIKRGRKGNKNDIEERLNKNIKLKEKMILNNKTNLQLMINEIDYLEEEVEENEAPDRKEKLEKMLEELRTTQNKKKKEIEELKTMKTEHNKICTKRLRELLKQYDRIKSDLEFERKINNNNLIRNSANQSLKTMKTDLNDNNQNIKF